jgi:hypothetical protein
VRHKRSVALTQDLHELDELQVVSKREYRRGYLAQVNGDLTRLKYRKIMSIPSGQLLVSRPAAGDERLKMTARRVGGLVGLFLVVAWPVTIVGAFLLLAVIVSVFR